MKRFWRKLRSQWTLVAILTAGVIAFVFLPNNAFKDVTQELIALFGLMMAGVLPTMVLTASVLRAGNLSVKTLKQYRDALRRQMLLWIGLFIVSLSASLLVVFGKIVNWTIVVSLPLSWLKLQDTKFETVHLLNALIAMALAVVLFRAITVGNGILSLLGLSAELAISEAQDREDARHLKAEGAIKEMGEREGYGGYVDIAH